jgi:RNA polymerase sigma-B factor
MLYNIGRKILTNSLRKQVKEITKHTQPLRLTKEEVLELIAEYQNHNCEEASTHLVLHFKGLVESLALRYSKGRSLHEDIVQVGMLGLLGAIRRFDHSLKNNFESFAVPTIIGEIKRFLRDKTWSVHVPRRVKELYPKISMATSDLNMILHRSPTIAEIADYLDKSEEDILEVMETGKNYQTLSFDHTSEGAADGTTFSLLDLVGKSEYGFELVEQQLVLNSIVHVLNDKERSVLQYTYIDNMSQKQAGELLGISQMHVSRLQRKAIQKLNKEYIKEEENYHHQEEERMYFLA